MEDIADPSDWLHTPLSSFSDLENALHCQICKEFYDTPMITSCNHTFCSRCIRTSLSQDGKCPGCRSQDQASKLRNNWALEEVVGRFVTARPTALDVARREKERQDEIANTTQRPGKRKRQAVDATGPEVEGRATRSKSRKVAASQSSQLEAIEIEDESDLESTPQSGQKHTQPDDGLVECPLGCGKRMKEETVFGHLDKCEDEKKRDAQREREVQRSRHISQTKQGSTSSSQRISELNYGMMNQGAIAKKLRDLGIPSWGSKQLMQRRHTEWVNLWNANIDSNNPQNKRELLKELDSWERTQGGKAPNANGHVNGVMRKDFDGDDWANRNKDQFSKLIADARRKKSAPAEDQQDSGQVSAKAAGIYDGLRGAADVDASLTCDKSDAVATLTAAVETDDMPAPYEDNEEALSSIRGKVAALNAGKHVEAVSNKAFEDPHGDNASTQNDDKNDLASAPSKLGVGNVSLLGQSHFGVSRDEHNLSQGEYGTPDLGRKLTHIEHDTKSPPAPKKLPMFDVPKHPVRDVDGGGIAQ